MGSRKHAQQENWQKYLNGQFSSKKSFSTIERILKLKKKKKIGFWNFGEIFSPKKYGRQYNDDYQVDYYLY